MSASLARAAVRAHRITSNTRALSTANKHFSKFLNEENQPKTVSVIGAPLAKGQPLLGVDQGPTFIRNHGLAERLTQDKWTINDIGNLDFASLTHHNHNNNSNGSALLDHTGQPIRKHPRASHSHIVGPSNELLYQATRKAHQQNHFALTLGGDHSVAIGSISGLLSVRPDAGIIWVDAHGDINTPESSSSGNIHGMVLSFLMNTANVRQEVPYFDWMNNNSNHTPSSTSSNNVTPSLAVPLFNATKNLVYIGLRDVDSGEKRMLREFGIRAYSMYELDKYGVSKVMEMALDHVLSVKHNSSTGAAMPSSLGADAYSSVRPLHLSFDIDSVDPKYAPSTGTRVAGGLSYREAYFICESIAETQCLVSMDLVEVNPLLNDVHKKGQHEKGVAPVVEDPTLSMACGLIASAMGNTIM